MTNKRRRTVSRFFKSESSAVLPVKPFGQVKKFRHLKRVMMIWKADDVWSFAHGPGQIHSWDFMAVPPRRHMAFFCFLYIAKQTGKERFLSRFVLLKRMLSVLLFVLVLLVLLFLLLILLILLVLLLIVFRFLHEWSPPKISGEEISKSLDTSMAFWRDIIHGMW